MKNLFNVRPQCLSLRLTPNFDQATPKPSLVCEPFKGNLLVCFGPCCITRVYLRFRAHSPSGFYSKQQNSCFHQLSFQGPEVVGMLSSFHEMLFYSRHDGMQTSWKLPQTVFHCFLGIIMIIWGNLVNSGFHLGTCMDAIFAQSLFYC